MGLCGGAARSVSAFDKYMPSNISYIGMYFVTKTKEDAMYKYIWETKIFKAFSISNVHVITPRGW